jgi:hypothetical protein
MTGRPTDRLIELLSADVAPVRPLRSPTRRALETLALLAALGALAILLLPDSNPLAVRGTGEKVQAGMELAAMLATGTLAVVGAFHLSIPGRSRRWLALPLLSFAAWLMLSGVGCYRDFILRDSAGLELGHSVDCLVFILGASLLLGAPLIWRLSRAAPIDPLPVAALGGLGAAAFSAFLLQFFHPFAVTFLDLAVHLVAIAIVIGLTALLKRPILRPA